MPRRSSSPARKIWRIGKASTGAERTKGREHPRAAKGLLPGRPRLAPGRFVPRVAGTAALNLVAASTRRALVCLD